MPSTRPSPQLEEKKRLSGCLLVMIILTVIILGILGWMLLWGRSISEGQDKDNSTTTSATVS